MMQPAIRMAQCEYQPRRRLVTGDAYDGAFDGSLSLHGLRGDGVDEFAAPLAMRLWARATASASGSSPLLRRVQPCGAVGWTCPGHGMPPPPSSTSAGFGCHARALGGVFTRASKRPRRTPWPAARA